MIAKIDDTGQLWIDGKKASLGQFGALLMGWKSQPAKPTVLLTASPKAPKVQVLVVTQLLKAEGIPWQRADVVKAPKKAPAPTPAPGVTDWAKMPLAYQRKAKGQPGLLEVRGQVLGADRKPLPLAFVGLVSRRQGKRDPQAVIRSDAAGHFRFRLKAQAGSTYRLSLLQGRKVLEFPLPLQRAQGGLLYLRIALPASRAVPAQRARAVPPRPTVRRPVVAAKKPTPRTSGPKAKQPGKRGRPSNVLLTKSKGKKASRPCNWSKVRPKSASRVSAKGRLVLRVHLLNTDGSPAGRIPTGIVSVFKRKSKLISRAYSDNNGCLAYVIDRELPGMYQMFVFPRGKVYAHRFPRLKEKAKGKASVEVPIWLSTKSVQDMPKTQFSALFMFFESADLDWIKANFVATIFYMPVPGKPAPPPFVIPIPKGAVRLGLDRELRRLRPTLRKDGLHLSRLKPGRNRLWLSFLMPRNTDAEAIVNLSISQQIKHVRVYFERGKLHPRGIKKQLKTETFGKKHKIKFDVLSFGEAQPDQHLKFVVAPTKAPPGGLIGWIARMKRHRKKNKLLGLGLLLGISCLGLCLVFAVPRSSAASDPGTSSGA